MIIFEKKKISDNFYLLHCPDYCIYLISGEYAAIIETGISQIIPDVIKSIDDFGINRKKIKYLIVLHSHFDHSGGISVFKREFPEIKILGLQPTKDILSDDYQIELIKKGLEKTSKNPLYSKGEILIEKEIVEVVKDGDELNLGDDILLKFFETPGHSSCAMSVYENKNKAFFISDNFGSIYPSSEKNNILKIEELKNSSLPFEGIKVWTTAFDNYEKYIMNFDRVRNLNLNINYLCFGHVGILTGNVCLSFFEFSKYNAILLKETMQEKFQDLKDAEQLLKYLQDNNFKELLYYFPSFIVKWGTRAMFKSMRIIK